MGVHDRRYRRGTRRSRAVVGASLAFIGLCVTTRGTASNEARKIVVADASFMGADRVAVPWLFKGPATWARGITAPLEGNVNGRWQSLGDATITLPYLLALPTDQTIFGVGIRSNPPARLGGANCTRVDAGRRWIEANRLELAVAPAARLGVDTSIELRVEWQGAHVPVTYEETDPASHMAVLLLQFDDGTDQCDESREIPPNPPTPVRLTASTSDCWVLVKTPGASTSANEGFRAARCRSSGLPTDVEVGPGMTADDEGASVWLGGSDVRLAGWLSGPPTDDGWLRLTAVRDLYAIFKKAALASADTTETTPYLGVALETPKGGAPGSPPQGAQITSVVANGPAASSGLQLNDIVVGFNDAPVVDKSDLPALIRGAHIGDRVQLTVVREDHRLHIDATLGAYPAGGS